MSTYGTNRSQGVGGGGGGGGANTALSNLTSPTAINQDLLPGADGALNLGGGVQRFGAGYISALHLSTITGEGSGVTINSGNNNTIDLIATGSGQIVLLTDAGGAIQMGAPSVLFFGAVADMGTGSIINLVDPTNPQDAATKAYVDSKAPGAGTVTSVSIVAANGFDGSVATATTTPAITLSTTITGILQGNGTAISAATVGALTAAGTDGIAVTSGAGAVLGSGTSIAQHVADSTHNGYLSSTDWSTFNGKQAALTIGNLTDVGTDGITVTGGTGAVIGTGASIAQHVADATHNGYLSSTDWSAFNGKQASGNYITALTGDVTASGPGSVAATIAAGAVSLAKMANLAANSIIGNNTGSPATPIALTAAQVNTLLGTMSNPMTTAGDMIYGGSSGTPTRLVAVASAGQVPITGASGTSVAFGTLPGNATALKAPTITTLTSTGTTTGYLFTVTSANATVGATYTNNGHTYTVLATISAGTQLFCSQPLAPAASGTLTKASGTGDATITFSANVALATFTSATSPAPLYTKVRMVGGGGGGSSSGTASWVVGGVGGTTAFGAGLLNAGGGSGGAAAGATGLGGAGGTASIGVGASGLALSGGSGAAVFTFQSSKAQNDTGGSGAASAFGGGGGGGDGNATAGQSGAANTGGGGGGGGAGNTATNFTGAGGGAGGYVDALISSPAAAYVYTIGAGGVGGTLGASGAAGGAGGSGVIIVEEHFQ